jgi:phosphatidylglycerophosphatase A
VILLLARSIATVGGLGLIPLAPGTFGSIPGLLMHEYFGIPAPFKWALLLSLVLIGTWAAKVFDNSSGSKDHPSIVIDETCGMSLVCLLAPTHALSPFPSMLLSFLLFRFFDIAKVLPVNLVDRWSKSHKEPWMRAWGVMLDDVLAAIQAIAVRWLLVAGYIHFLKGL